MISHPKLFTELKADDVKTRIPGDFAIIPAPREPNDAAVEFMRQVIDGRMR